MYKVRRTYIYWISTWLGATLALFIGNVEAAEGKAEGQLEGIKPQEIGKN